MWGGRGREGLQGQRPELQGGTCWTMTRPDVVQGMGCTCYWECLCTSSSTLRLQGPVCQRVSHPDIGASLALPTRRLMGLMHAMQAVRHVCMHACMCRCGGWHGGPTGPGSGPGGGGGCAMHDCSRPTRTNYTRCRTGFWTAEARQRWLALAPIPTPSIAEPHGPGRPKAGKAELATTR